MAPSEKLGRVVLFFLYQELVRLPTTFGIRTSPITSIQTARSGTPCPDVSKVEGAITDTAYDPSEPPSDLSDEVVSILLRAQSTRRTFDDTRPCPDGMPDRASRHTEGVEFAVEQRSDLLVAVGLVEHSSHTGT